MERVLAAPAPSQKCVLTNPCPTMTRVDHDVFFSARQVAVVLTSLPIPTLHRLRHGETLP